MCLLRQNKRPPRQANTNTIPPQQSLPMVRDMARSTRQLAASTGAGRAPQRDTHHTHTHRQAHTKQDHMSACNTTPPERMVHLESPDLAATTSSLPRGRAQSHGSRRTAPLRQAEKIAEQGSRNEESAADSDCWQLTARRSGKRRATSEPESEASGVRHAEARRVFRGRNVCASGWGRGSGHGSTFQPSSRR